MNGEAALRSEENSDKDRVNNKLAPRTVGPFPVVQVDDHIFTVLRGAGLKDQLSRDRVVKSSPLRNNVEDTQPQLAVSDGGKGNSPELPPQTGPSLHWRQHHRARRVWWTASRAGKPRMPSPDSLDSALRSGRTAPYPRTTPRGRTRGR